MVSRIGASYLFELEVNWAVGAGDVTGQLLVMKTTLYKKKQ